MRRVFGLAALVLAGPAWAQGGWQVVHENAAEIVAVNVASVERHAEGIRFHERRSLRGSQVDVHSQRPLREVLARRVADCRGRRMATLSRAVFADHDALVEHHAVRPRNASWQPVVADDPVFRRICGAS